MRSLASGSRLGLYEILNPLTESENLYKASDTRTGRTVVIRIIEPEIVANSEARRRFDSELRRIASLNHPNICAPAEIEEHDGVSFLAMEFLEGETLAARLQRGSLGVGEALKLSVALASALEQAHRQGVVHGALNPSNVLLTEAGPKLLNFGLSRLSPSLEHLSPEQSGGIEADARSDVFAFGALLYEMVSGRKASAEPEPLSSVESSAPPILEHVVMTCLARSPADRWQTAGDLLAELEWISQHSARTIVARPIAARYHRRGRLFRALFAAAALLAGALTLPAFRYVRGSPEPDAFLFTTLPENTTYYNFAVSPDGRWIAHRISTTGDNARLYLRRIGAVTSEPFPETAVMELPFWSPDSRWIGFKQGERLRKVEVSGGLAQDICDAGDFKGGVWNRDGTIVFGTTKGLFRVSDQGGKPEAITTLEPSESGHFWPLFLPDGRRYLYLSWSEQASKRAIYAGSLDSKEKTRVMASESNVLYSPPGYLLFRRGDALYTQAFDAKKLGLSGDSFRVAGGVTFTPATGRGHFSVSQNGVLAYDYNTNIGAAPTTVDAEPRLLSWIDRQVLPIDVPARSGAYRGVSVSPDGKHIAVHLHDGTGGDIWIIEPDGRANRFTFDASRDNSMPVWSPDGSRIVYASLQKGKWGLYQSLSNGTGMEELLWEDERPKAPLSWVGKHIVFWVQDPKTAGDIWVLPLEGDRKPFPFANEAFNETHAQASPDGKWLAYTSNQTGNRNEIYVRSFPSGSGIRQISTNGGDWPRWKHDSTELFYRDPSADAVSTGIEYSVAVRAVGAEFKAAQPEPLLGLPIFNEPHSGDYLPYDVSPDGQRFLYFRLDRGNTASAASTTVQYSSDPPTGFAVVLHWLSALRK